MGVSDGKKEEKRPLKVVFRIFFCCKECVRRVKKAAASIDGVQSIDVEQDRLIIYGFVDPHKVAKKLRSKTGKHMELLLDEKEKKRDAKEEKRHDVKEEMKEKFKEGGPSFRKEERYESHNGPRDRVMYEDMFNDENATGCSVM